MARAALCEPELFFAAFEIHSVNWSSSFFPTMLYKSSIQNDDYWKKVT